MLRRLLAPLTGSFTGMINSEPKTVDEAILDINNALASKSEQKLCDAVNNLNRVCYSSKDLSFVGYSVTSLLASSDPKCRTVGFIAISLFLTPSSPSVAMLPSIMRKSFQYQELVVPALRALTFVMNEFVFKSIKDDIIEIGTNSHDVPRLLAMHCVYLAWRQHHGYIKYLIPLVKRALSHPALRFTASTIMAEVAQETPEELISLVDLSLEDIQFANTHMFAKFCCFYRAMLQLDVIKNDNAKCAKISKALHKYLTKHNNFIALYECALTSKYCNFSKEFISLIGQSLQSNLVSQCDNNTKSLTFLGLSYISDRFNADTTLLQGSANTEDTYVRSAALRLRLSQPGGERAQYMNELLKLSVETKDLDLVKTVIDSLPKTGALYARMLVGLCDVRAYSVGILLANLIKSVDDNETASHLLDFARENDLFSDDDIVATALCEFAGSHSSDENDYCLIITGAIASFSQQSIRVRIDACTEIFLRTSIQIPRIVTMRLELLAQSPHTDIRQSVSMLIELASSPNS